MDYLFVVCLTLLSIFLIALLQKRRKTLADKILIFWQVLLILTELTFLLQQNGYFKQYYLFFELICTSHILHGTFLFFYYRSFSNPKFSFRLIHLLHLIPFVALASTKFLMGEVFQVLNCREEGGCSCTDNPYTNWLNLIKIVVIGSYVLYTYIWHTSHKRTEKFLFQNGAEAQAWINIVVHGTVALFLLIATIQLLPVVSVINIDAEADVTNTVISVFVLLFLYAGNKHAYIIVNPFTQNSEAISGSQQEFPKPFDERLQEHFIMVEKAMVENQAYLDPELSLISFAELVGLPSLAVSQAIKASTGQSFPYYINSFRITAILEKLKDPNFRQYTIIALAFDCGFNSKASFNRIFKLHTGKTPSEFIAELPKSETDQA